jgi:hypothetical protein
MINLKLTIFAILGGVRRCGGQAFFDKLGGRDKLKDTAIPPCGCRISQTERADNRTSHLRVIGSASLHLAL